MSIYGVLGINDHERVYLQKLGQSVVYDAVNEYLTQHDAELAAMTALFVETTTDQHSERYILPGGGRMQQMSGQARSGNVKRTGKWDVSYPLFDFSDSVGMDRIGFAYATVQDLATQMDTIRTRNINTARFEILKALFNNATDAFGDEINGNLTIQPLANGDAVLYPPTLGNEEAATDDHYLESGYATASISDANDPVVTAVDELTEHFGDPTGNADIVILAGRTVARKLKGLTEFVKVQDKNVDPGDDEATVIGGIAIPGKLIGRHEAGAWISEWQWIPANYILAIHTETRAPLKRRVHPDYTGLPQALTLVKESDTYPVEQSHYENHYGFGCGNRLNGVVIELGTGGSYSVPAAYQ